MTKNTIFSAPNEFINVFTNAIGDLHNAIVSLPKNAFLALYRLQQRAKDRQHLANLDSYLLKDMGLTREGAQVEISKHF